VRGLCVVVAALPSLRVAAFRLIQPAMPEFSGHFNLTLKSRQVSVGGSHLFWKENCFTIPAPFASIKQALHPSVSAPSGDEITVIRLSFFSPFLLGSNAWSVI
jgi:hypothetical protein